MKTRRSRTRASKDKACNGKQSYPSREAATAAKYWVADMSGAANRSLNAYKCRHCGGWHIGHTPQLKRRGR